MNKKIIIYISVFVTMLVVLYLVLNYQYVWKQVTYSVTGQANTTNPNTEMPTASGEQYEPNTVTIPSLGINAPIKFVTEINEAVFQEALQNGVVQFPNTAPIGSVGNTYIFGHSSDFALSKGDYKTVFALLPNIKSDAEIMVTNAEGKLFTYVVTDTFVANNTDLHLLDQNTGGKAILTLQTSYPIGTALKRYIVKAELKP